MSRNALLVLSTVLLSSVAACGGGGGGDGDNGSIGPINCGGLTGATSTSTLTCSVGDCAAAFHQAAIDGDLGTYAILSMTPNSAGSISLRATAQDGVTYPAGTPAAVVYGIQRTGNSISAAETISTYLDGVLQETANTGSGGVDGFDRPAGRRAIGTALPFDAIELTYAQSGGDVDLEVQIYEFCTSTN